jgi:hypothetical protein
MVTRRRLAITAGTIVGVAIVLLVALWLGVPAAVRWGLETVAAREIGRAMHVAEVKFNPFKLRLQVRGFVIDGTAADPQPLLQLDELDTQLGASSIVRFAPIVKSLRLQGVRAYLARTAPNRLNISDIIERVTAKPPSPDDAKDDEPGRFAVFNIELNDGAITLDDRVVGQQHEATAISLGIPFVSSLPDDIEIKVQPAFAATINGAPFKLEGQTLPFHDTLDTVVALRFGGLSLPRYLDYSPVALGFKVRSGVLDTDLRITFRRATPASEQKPATPARLLLTGTASITDFALVPSDMNHPLLQWQRLEVDVGEVGLFQGQGQLRSVTLRSPTLDIVRRADGSLAGVANLVPGSGAAAPAEPAETPTKKAAPFALDVAQIRVVDGRISVSDEMVGFKRRLQPVDVAIDGFSTRKDAAATLALTALADDKTQLKGDGSVVLEPLKVDAEVSVARLPLAELMPYLRDTLDASLAGSVEAKARIRVDDGVGGAAPRIESGAVVVNDLRIAGPRGNTAQLQATKIEVSGISADVHERRVDVERSSVRGARLRAQRLADGSIDWQRLIVAKAAAKPAGDGADWRVQLARFDLIKAQAVVKDEAVQPPVTVAAEALDARVERITTDSKARMPVDVRVRLGGGTLRANGWLRPTPLATSLKLQVDNIDVTAARPYAAPYVRAILASAAITADGAVDFDAGGASPAVRYEGGVRVTNFSMLNPDGESELTRWQALALDGVKIDTSPRPATIEIGKVALNDFYARAILSQQGQLNLVQVLKPASAAAEGTVQGDAATTEKTAAAQAPTAQSADKGAVIRVGGIELVRGNVNYTDNFVRPNYSANLTDLTGTVGALSSESAAMADVSVRGRVDGDAPLEITGQLNPLASELALDMRANAKGVELPRLTPYSVKYAGYPITKGKLSMDVAYLVKDGKLTADNRVFLDQLTFGDRVESPTATKLPVLFAVSLLKDREGNIDINLPISGSLDDPEFSIGGIIVRVIVNLITKVVTAPFSVLGAAVGGGADLGYVDFAPGSAALTEAAIKKLEMLAKALNDRPALKLDINGRALAAADTEPLRDGLFERKLRAAKVRGVVRAGQSVDPATVTIDADEREALIADVYAAEKIPNKPRNFLGLAKDIPSAEMERLILGTIKVEEEDLRRLANDRATAVRNHLASHGNVATDRMFLVAPVLEASSGEAGKLAPSRVDFSLK